MVEHRKNVPTRKAYVPSGWFIVLTIMICLGGAGWLATLVVGDSGDDTAPARTSATPKPSATPSTSASPEPASPEPESTKKTPKPTPSPSASSAAPTAAREASVSVLNNTGIVGAAKAFSVKVASAGWTLGGIGNWTGSIDGNTIYYPAPLQAQAELLGQDVGIDRIRPSVAPMRMDRLTIILSDPR